MNDQLMTTQVMLDLESLGKKRGSIILAIRTVSSETVKSPMNFMPA
jgi:hypothetical protein